MTTPLSVYVAGSSAELARVEYVLDALRDAGCRVAHDWTLDVREACSSGYRTDADLDDVTARRLASEDLIAVPRADVVLFLAPLTPSRGAWVELGVALGMALDISVIVSGSAARASIFTSLADALYDTDEEAVAAIGAMASEAEAL